MSLFTKVSILVVFTWLQFGAVSLHAQSVSVGQGSYSTTLPPGADRPPVSPKVVDDFEKPVTTNHFWSSLIFPLRNNPHSNNMFAHPLNLKAAATGLEMGYTFDPVVNNTDYIFPYTSQLTVGVAGLSAAQTLTKDYGDWTVTAHWSDGTRTMDATFGHGLPFAFFEVTGGDALITPSATPDIWFQQGEVMGITVDGRHYGLFAPAGATWTGTSSITSDLNGKGFFSVALLPDASSTTLELFRSRAYAFVTNSTVEWDFDESNARVTTTYSYETTLMDSAAGNLNETLTALYRHQWLYVNESLTSHTYESARGTMYLLEGSTFSTDMRFSGILPAMPDAGSYDRFKLIEFVKQAAQETLGGGATYQSGKAMGRFAQLIPIADQLGLVAERDHFLAELKSRLEEWLSTGGSQEYSFIEDWDAIVGYPSGFGADRELNDHHFHASYAVFSASVIAKYDSVWAAQENWGGMINLLVRNAGNWERSYTKFPFLRNFDVYAGHSWAAGHADFPDGNNQESSSESMHFNTAVFLWGLETEQDDIRDLGAYLFTTEAAAVEQYWFDVHDQVFPSNYSKEALGIVWGGKGVHTTWFGGQPEFIHGINFLPITAASLYLGHHPQYILDNYNEIVAERGGQPVVWKDVLWSFLALSDAEQAIAFYEGDPQYEAFDGESRARTMHWLYNLREMGQVDTTTTADIASYAVLVNDTDDTTYVAYNAGDLPRTVRFSNGFSMEAAPGELAWFNKNKQTFPMGPAPDPSVDTGGVISIFSDLFPAFTGVDFKVDEGQQTTVDIVPIDRNNTLWLQDLDRQLFQFEESIDLNSRTSFHLDYFSDDASELFVALTDANGQSRYNISVETGSWQSLNIPLSTFTDSVDLSSITGILIEGNGSVLMDNIYFFGAAPLDDGPQSAAPAPERDEAQVLSIYSDTYSNLPGVDLNPNWGQETMVSEVEIDGNNTLKYEQLNYQGTDLGGAQDVSGMSGFHLDYWTDTDMDLRVSLISSGPQETPVSIDVQANSWQSVEIPLSDYESVVDLSQVIQIKIEGSGTLYLDNFYFYENPSITPAPDPTADSSQVISLFSNAFNNHPVDTWSAGWDRADVEDVSVDGNDMKRYTNLSYSGIEFIQQTIDARQMTHFRFDMWTPDEIMESDDFRIKLVDFGEDGRWSGGDDTEHELIFDLTTTPALEQFKWIHFDLPLDDFENMLNREHVAQLLFIGSSGINEVYIDNIYFFTEGLINNREDEFSALPEEVMLSQNYPNPFNPSTQIQYGVPESANVSLRIFNTLGQQVANLVDGRRSAGTHTVTWNAANLPSGMYVYELRVNDVRMIRKMLLMK